jgi:tetratricopeptide (TPR) repeat protein
MQSNRSKAASFLATAAIAGSLCPTEDIYAQSVSDRVLSDVTAQSVGTCATVSIAFNVRVQILSSFPQTGGRELHIRLKPLDGTSLSRESLRAPTGIPALRSIQYEGDNASGPILSLFFNRDVRFDVAAGKTPQTVIVTISEAGDLSSCSAAGAGGPVGAAAEARPPAEPVAQAKPAIPIPSGLYVINVLSQPQEIGDLPPTKAQALAGTVTYETRFERDGQTWHRLRAGFFDSREAADSARARLAGQFPESWVVKVTAQERAQGVATRLDIGGGTPVATQVTSAAPLSAEQQLAAAKAEADAETALKAGENDRAIQILTQALQLPENEHSPRARELLGLTRERKGQAAHAQAEYEEYLRRYPTGEAADRVRQRLAALLNPASQTGPELRAATGRGAVAEASNAWRWGARGSFSQFYFRDQSTSKFLDATRVDPTAEVDNSVNLNQLLTNADISLTGGSDRNQLLLRAAGSYTRDFRPASTHTDPFTGVQTLRRNHVKSISALYFDFSDSTLNVSGRIGRQTRNGSGILGRFDGGLLGWQVRPKVRLNVSAGFPVSSSRITHIQNDRFFYGVSADIGSKNDKLQTTFYWFDQRSHGLIDRRSVGNEMRYLNNRFNAYTIFDYDVHFKKVNLGLVTLNYSLKDQSSVSFTADYRQSPLLTTTSALNGIFAQTLPGGTTKIRTLADLRASLTDQQIYQLAQDNTQVTKSVTVSYSRPITAKLQGNFDFTMTNTGGYYGSTRVIPAANPPLNPLQPAIGREFYYGAQLVGSGMIFSNDIYILSGRYANNERSRTYTADINARIPVTNKFRLSPRARYGYRDDKLTASTFRQFQPTLRINYYPIRRSEIEIEIGGNFSRQHQISAGIDSVSTERGIVLTAGYRLDF